MAPTQLSETEQPKARPASRTAAAPRTSPNVFFSTIVFPVDVKKDDPQEKVRAGGKEYLVRLRDARGNGKSLGPRSTETERIHAAFATNKQRADERSATLSAALKQQARLNKAVRLGRLPALIGRILHALDLARAEPPLHRDRHSCSLRLRGHGRRAMFDGFAGVR